jgi:hypothetical protein
MSHPAKFLLFLGRAIDAGRGLPGYQAVIERESLRMRMRIIAARIIEGRT